LAFLGTKIDKGTGVRSDHTVILTSFESASVYPDALRRVTFLDVEKQKRFKFLTNNFTLPAPVIAQIYKSRWAVELFFKWIKQHLRIKAFYGTSENAVKTQIWIAGRCMCWSPSHERGWTWKPVSTKLHRF
jgi:transposase